MVANSSALLRVGRGAGLGDFDLYMLTQDQLDQPVTRMMRHLKICTAGPGCRQGKGRKGPSVMRQALTYDPAFWHHTHVS